MLAKFFAKPEQKIVPGLLSISFDSEGIALAYQPEVKTKPSFSVCTYIQMDDGTDPVALLKGFVETNGLQGAHCNIVLNPSDYRLVFLDAPSVDETELGAAAKWLVKDFIDFPVEEAVVDAFALPVRAGQQKKMYAVVAKTDYVKGRVAMLEQAGLVAQYVDIAELALRNIMQYLEEGNKEAVLLLIRPDLHVLLVTCEKILCLSRNIETELDYLPAVDNAPEQDDAIAHLANELERSIGYFQSHIGQGEFSKLWVSSLLPEQTKLMEALKETINIPIEILNLNQVFAFGETLEPKKQVKTLLAIGGALRLELSNEATN